MAGMCCVLADSAWEWIRAAMKPLCMALEVKSALNDTRKQKDKEAESFLYPCPSHLCSLQCWSYWQSKEQLTGKRKEKVRYLCFWLGFPLIPGNLTLRSMPGQRGRALRKQQWPWLTEGNVIVCPCTPVDGSNLRRYCRFRAKRYLTQILNKAIFTCLARQTWEQQDPHFHNGKIILRCSALWLLHADWEPADNKWYNMRLFVLLH